MIPELVIASGKGGTGKTSLAAAFAVLAGPQAVIVDGDVDAADLHLVLPPVVRTRHAFPGQPAAAIAPDACTGCGACQAHCRFGAITPAKSTSTSSTTYYEVSEVRCEGCGLCRARCPAGAIRMKERAAGEWMISGTPGGPLVHARLFPGAGSSGKLVAVLKHAAHELAAASRAPLILVDGPPGVGCPAIAAISGASLLLAVTEPTPAGEADLERLLELAHALRVPARVCVNRWDINPDQTEKMEATALHLDAPAAGRIRYDPAVVAAQRQGQSLADFAAAGNSAGAWEDVQSVWRTVLHGLSSGPSFARDPIPTLSPAQNPNATPRRIP